MIRTSGEHTDKRGDKRMVFTQTGGVVIQATIVARAHTKNIARAACTGAGMTLKWIRLLDRF